MDFNMELSTALKNYYGGDESAFKDIWNNVRGYINWTRAYDPTRAMTREDFQMECCEHLWKKMDKFDKSRGSFKTFAINVIYRYLFQRVKRYLKKFWVSEMKLPVIYDLSCCYNVYTEINADDQAMFEYTANLIISYFNEPVLKDIYSILIFDSDKFYFAGNSKNSSTIHKIAEKHNMTTREVIRLIKRYKKEVKEIILGE